MLRNWHAHYYQEVTSTMDIAHDLVCKKGLSISDGLLILASEQTAGRGRRQRDWTSPEGNFYGTFAFLPQLSEASYPLYSFAAAMALYDAINQISDKEYLLNVKWPNDLLFNGKKVAGILLELSDTQPKHLIVGIGVNLSSTPANTSYPATDLNTENQINMEVEEFIPHLLPHLTSALDLLETQGFEPIRKAWLAARYPQDDMCIKCPNRDECKEIKGTFLDLDSEGRLIVRDSQTNEPVKICSGDLYF
jgi:BirA family biotin operon repressor/biotin-[acetyl-CoA-carboxylase] ligase